MFLGSILFICSLISVISLSSKEKNAFKALSMSSTPPARSNFSLIFLDLLL
jgi:hypothetical protein